MSLHSDGTIQMVLVLPFDVSLERRTPTEGRGAGPKMTWLGALPVLLPFADRACGERRELVTVRIKLEGSHFLTSFGTITK